MVEREPAPKKAEHSNSPERIIDDSPPHPIEQFFIDQYSGQPELQSLHCVMTFGIVARDCKFPYITMNPDAPCASRYTDEPLQTFSRLLGNVLLAGKASRNEVECSPRVPVLWAEMYRTMQEIRVTDPSRPSLSSRLFDEQLQRGIDRNNRFIKRQSPLSDELLIQQEESLRNVAHDVRTASELIVCTALEAHDSKKLQQHIQRLNTDVWLDFSDQYYWKRDDPFRSLQNRLRQDDLNQIKYNILEAHKKSASSSI